MGWMIRKTLVRYYSEKYVPFSCPIMTDGKKYYWAKWCGINQAINWTSQRYSSSLKFPREHKITPSSGWTTNSKIISISLADFMYLFFFKSLALLFSKHSSSVLLTKHPVYVSVVEVFSKKASYRRLFTA